MPTEEQIERLRSRYERILVETLRRALLQEAVEVEADGLPAIREDRWTGAILMPFQEAANDAWDVTQIELGPEEKAWRPGANASDAVKRIVARGRAIAERNRTRLLAAVAESGGSLTESVVDRIYRSELAGLLPHDAAHSIVEAVSWGQNQAALATGRAVIRIWRTVGDDRVRPSHRDASGQERPLGAPFSVGGASLDFPGDSSGPVEEWINCRCYLEFQTLVSTAPAGSPVAEFARR